jgi:hypothetical protein
MSPVLIAFAAIAEGGIDAWVFASIIAALAACLTLAAYHANWRARVEPVQVRADAEGVVVNGRLTPRASIRAGLATPGISPRVVLRRHLRFPVELQTESQEEAGALLHSLGLDASQKFADFYGRSWIEARWAYVVGVFLAFSLVGFVCSKLGEVGKVLLVPLWVMGVAVWLMPTRLRVGRDGVAIRWLWVHRIIGYGEIEDVGRYEQISGVGITTIGLQIQVRTGMVRVPMGVRRWTVFGTWQRGESNLALAWERMREAARLFHRKTAARAEDDARGKGR